jgi:Ser/Thr protein kinase RdoA (MazF antagonist)
VSLRAGYPTHEFMLTVDGARIAMMNDRVGVLIPWVDGDTPEPNSVSSPRALTQIGALCGRLHRLAPEYPQPPVADHAALSRSIADKRASSAHRGDQVLRDDVARSVESCFGIEPAQAALLDEPSSKIVPDTQPTHPQIGLSL